MDERPDNELLQAALLRYLDVLRSSGSRPESIALGAVVCLLALHKDNNPDRIMKALPREMDSFLRGIVGEFETDFLVNYRDLNNVYHIPFAHPALHRFLYEVGSLHIELGMEMFELLDTVYSIPNGKSGEFVTPSSVAELMADLVQVSSGETLFDPCMGSGGFLNAVQQTGLTDFQFWGGDKNAFNLVVVRLKTLLSNQHYHEIRGSSFAFTSDLPQFDVVLSNPPIRKLKRDQARHMYSDSLRGVAYQDMSANFIELGLQHLKPEGRAAYLVPMGLLFQAGDAEQARKNWLQSGMLKLVISLPDNLLPHTGLRCAILLFKNSERKESVRFIKADEYFENGHRRQNRLSYENIKTILSMSLSDHPKDGVINADYSAIADNQYCLIPSEYIPVEESNIGHLSEEWSKIGNIADVFQGTSLSQVEGGDQPVIRGKDLRTSQIDLDDLAKKDLTSFSKPVRYAERGDILLQRIGANPAAYLVGVREQGCAVEDTVFIIRSSSLDLDQMDFICQFLNSDQVASRISNARSYSVIPTQTLKSIRTLEVPIPNSKIIDLVREMNALEASLKNEYEKAREYKKALFDGYDPSDISSRFEDARFTANALEAALKQKDDIKYRVRTQYPFPLAFAYRNIYLEHEYAGIYERQMKYGEQLLSFLSAVGIALSVKYGGIDNNSNKVELLKEFQSYVRRGLSPGDFQTILQKACKVLSSVKEPIAQSFSQVWYKPGGKKESVFAKNARESLVSKLNDYKHHRGPSNRHERKLVGEEQSRTLDKLLMHIEFISDCELIRIDKIDKQWRGDELMYSASMLKGDHPAFEKIQFSSEQNLSIDKLYIQHKSDFICLYPMVSLAYNPYTRKEEIFSIDKESGHGFMLKSFESGTSVESKEVRSDFIYWVEKMLNRSDELELC
ncbi:N-6 DNA methylase [Saccharospirillum alexandrii]|uniref:N-6 DNA methylase n=1 Tax=Saccharospirillum alexandrii TaxID=2448477 RepID=UPI003735BDBE